MSSPAEQVANLLSASVVGGSSGWLLRIGKKDESADRQIIFYDVGGGNPNPKWAVDFISIQALVRGVPDSYGETWTKAREVRDALLGIDSLTLTSGDRLVSITMMGDIAMMGYDTNSRPELSVNFRLIVEPVVTGNRDPL